MKVPAFNTKYNPGDIVIITWDDEYPELAMIESITNIVVNEGEAPLTEYRLKSPTYSSIHLNDRGGYPGDRCDDGIVCKFEDICNDKKVLETIKKAFKKAENIKEE